MDAGLVIFPVIVLNTLTKAIQERRVYFGSQWDVIARVSCSHMGHTVSVWERELSVRAGLTSPDSVPSI